MRVALVVLMALACAVPSCQRRSPVHAPPPITGTSTVIGGPLFVGGATVDDMYPNGDLIYAKRSLPDQLLVTINNPYSGPMPSGSGFVCVADTKNTGGLCVQNSNWPPGVDGTWPNECTLIGFGMPVAILTQGDRDIYVRPNEIEIAHFQYTGGVRKMSFNGNTTVPRPVVTGSRSTGAALASLLSALDQLGLITDNSTP